MSDYINTGDIHTTNQLATITPFKGNVLMDSDKNTLVIGDGATKGGIPIAREDAVGGTVPVLKSYNFSARSASSGTYYNAGFYEAAAADSNLTNASTTQTLGTANAAHASHAFIVAALAGVTDGSDLVLTVTGTSITDAGVRTGSDSQVIVSDCTTSSLNTYYETSKKWIGQITFTLSSTGGSTFNYDFNYGLAKYEDFGNRSFTLTDFEVTGLANSNDSGFDVILYKHSQTGWTYHASAFVPGNSVLAQLSTIHGAEREAVSGDQIAFKRAGMSTAIDGSASEGLVIAIITTVNNSLSYLNSHIGVTF